jgi:cellobiose phosphorylase
LFVPNSYFSIEGPNFGKSTRKSGSGTNAWMLWVMLKYILGVKATINGITFEDNLPECLKGTKVTVKFRDEFYRF